MPQLANPKRELYAKFLANGQTQNDAYTAAGYTPSSSNANHLANTPEIKMRVKEIKKEIENEQIELRIKMAAAGFDPNTPEGKEVVREWDADRVRTMFMQNAQLAQVVGDFKSAHESIKAIGDSLGMYDKVGGKNGRGDEAGTKVSIAVIGQATGGGSDGTGPLLEDSRNPLAPQLPDSRPAKRLADNRSVD